MEDACLLKIFQLENSIVFQAVWRNFTKKPGMKNLYSNKDHTIIAEQLHLFFALPFVKPEDIKDAYAAIIAPGHLDPRMQYMTEYFDPTWVGYYHGTSKFDHKLWNMHSQ